MSNPNCTYTGDDPALHPPSTSLACTTPIGGNNTAILQACCGGTPVVQFQGLLTTAAVTAGFAGNCLQYCNLSVSVPFIQAEDCLGDLGACYLSRGPVEESGARRERAPVWSSSSAGLGGVVVVFLVVGSLIGGWG